MSGVKKRRSRDAHLSMQISHLQTTGIYHLGLLNLHVATRRSIVLGVP